MAEAPPQSPPVLGPGATGPDVVALQTKLVDARYGPLDADGVYNRSTLEAVQRFQNAHSLPADGIAGPATIAALDTVLAGPVRPPLPPPEAQHLAISASLEALRDPSTVSTAFAVVRSLLQSHGTYAGGRAATFELGVQPQMTPARNFDQWIADVRPLFDEEALPRLDTRSMIWGLALLDETLGERLGTDGFLDALVSEIPHGHAILSEQGRKLAGLKRRDSSAPVLLDRPALVDRLGREAFAITLAARLIQLRNAVVPPRPSVWDRLRHVPAADHHEEENPGPFLVHLQGVWGAGKSTLLNFFARELRHPSPKLAEVVWGPEATEKPPLDRWIVVSFNAWQHQRIAPPWWWLMTAILHQGAHELRGISTREWLRFKRRDWGWRLRRHWPTIAAPLIALGIGSVVVWLLVTKTSAFENTGDKPLREFIVNIAGTVTAISAIVATVWGAIRVVRTWMLDSSARGAGRLMETTSDPMAAVQRRYEFLVDALGHPLAILIDDLDRCRADYVVELLEGIQTLFAHAPVTYVVAADSCWLRDSFLQVYAPFVSSTAGPGEALGYGFLEKSFQLSTSVPRMRPDLQERFLTGLLDPAVAATERLERARAGAEEQLRGTQSREEVQQAVAESETLAAPERAAVREAAALRLAGADIVLETEYVLADFATLLEPNPRAMKRLVNAYSFESRLQLLESDWVESGEDATQQLALWTILKLRWPSLADYLAEHPEAVALIGPKKPAGVPDALAPLFQSEEVRRVVTGSADGVSASLDEAALRGIVRPVETRSHAEGLAPA